jgi:DtxR family transcriptional regulator, Mn-dependent transcriptional regulator
MTLVEENYIKALFHISYDNDKFRVVGTNELAHHLGVKPATANNMLKKLKEKKYLSYEKYGKISLTSTGKKSALLLVRKHRLWETFLYEKLDFTWDEVHEVAEELEHINSEKLIEKLDKLLNFPKFDPHGDPIPNGENGQKNIG